MLLGNRCFTADCFRARTAAEEPAGGGGGLGAGEQSPAPAVWRQSRGANSSGRGGVAGTDSWERARREEPKKPTRAGATYSQIPPVPWAAEAGELRSGAAGEAEPLPATAGARQPPPAAPQRGAGPASPTCPPGLRLRLRAAPHLTAAAPLPPRGALRLRTRAARRPGAGGSPWRAARVERGGAEPSRAGPPRSPLRALSEPPALPGGGAAPRSGCGGPGLGLRDLRVTDKAAFRAFQPSVMTGRERRAFPVSSQVFLG